MDGNKALVRGLGQLVGDYVPAVAFRVNMGLSHSCVSMVASTIALLPKDYSRAHVLLLVCAGSQIVTRLATFGVNQLATRALSVEAFGLLSMRFHLINTTILMLSREGFRRGCLRMQKDSAHQVSTRKILSLASLSLPIGLLAAGFACWLFGPQAHESIPSYQKAVWLQAGAALLELASEPLYILGQARFKVGLRVSVEAVAMLCKVVSTITLIWWDHFNESISLSIAQILYAAALSLGYVMHFFPEWTTWLKLHRKQKNPGAMKDTFLDIDSSDLFLCSSFMAQAAEKLLLAEGTKMAMSQVQAAYDQGVYGLVANLGALVVRTFFQPIEEAAFLAFSRPLPTEGFGERLSTLALLLRGTMLLGLLAVAFGPGNSFLLLHILYGPKYSTTDAPAALALFSFYILLLAMNGILECFVHAVASGPELWQGHVALLAITAVQTSITLLLVSTYSTLGMIVADASGMGLRILYSSWFIRKYVARQCQSLQQNASQKERHPKLSHLSIGRLLQQSVPNAGLLSALSCAGVASAMSAAALLGQGLFSSSIRRVQLGFWSGAVLHISGEVGLLGFVMLVFFSTEASLRQAVGFTSKKQV